ncbi:hypothetical protein AGABI2DRAFT_209270 [Agaricus bisporus var. bisporus H97]|uniref:hypothetical protein n=1 Tax=Agaricus bisporus var. bisporus (strain H97 / ATCC MYA-4626 / FGSC 10389) TaxID=936046 RepID=UPI00029F5EEE|nr:hypothetical protein AGABI2DRAFT_209270 [Agaricus bisporus var. bisporus H97]EKV43756.1 hypothetical protein AGABI2DRAFT_209270 [Agaricus bisporus var. bisporus H97]
MMPTSDAIFSNPDSYLNHLSPQEAFEYETTRNVVLILLGATIWDLLATLSDDIKVLKRSRFRTATFCFIFSRVFALVYVLSNVIRRTTPVRNLYATTLSSIILCGMSIGCSSYLFLQRVRAVYTDRPRVQQCFTIFWMAYLASESIIGFSIKPVYIPNTRHFKEAGIQPLISLSVFVAIAYDSAVFLAISYKIGIAHVVMDREMGWKSFISGKALPRLSQAVLRGGQQYYLFIFLLLFPSGIALYIPSTPPMYKSMLTVFFAPLMASMSCRVYRGIKLFEYDVQAIPYPISEVQSI